MWEQRAGRRRGDDKVEDGAGGRAEVMEDLPQTPALPHLSFFSCGGTEQQRGSEGVCGLVHSRPHMRTLGLLCGLPT